GGRAFAAAGPRAREPGARPWALSGPAPPRHVVHLVGEILFVAIVALVLVGALEQLHLVARLLLALDEVDDLMDVAVGDVRSVEALHARRPRRQEEHVPLAEQALGADAVEDRARVRARRHLEREAR